MKLLINYSATVWDKVIPERGKTLIHHASINNEIAVLDFLLKLDKEKDYEMARTVNENGQTCLHCACGKGNTTIVKMLLNAVPELASEINNSGMNALHCACIRGHLDTAQTLYRHFCEEGFSNCIHDLNNEECNSFLLASESKKLKAVQKTVVSSDQECLINVNQSEQNKKSKIFPSEKCELVRSSGNADISEKKNQHRKVWWSVDEKENKNLHFAAFSGDVDLVKKVVSLETKLLPRLNRRKQNALHIACAEGHINTADWLFKQHQEFLWSVDKDGDNIMHFAAISGNLELVKWAVKKDASLLPSLNRRQRNAFYIACKEGHFNTAD